MVFGAKKRTFLKAMNDDLFAPKTIERVNEVENSLRASCCRLLCVRALVRVTKQATEEQAHGRCVVFRSNELAANPSVTESLH